MEFFIYIIIFIVGTLLGSFCTLAIYRIPLKQNITYERSYCPNCKHKLNFLDLIPVFSYIFLKGKCRYCHKEIRPRYFIIEIFSGIALVLFAISMKIDFITINLKQIVYFIFIMLYFVTLILVAGIDKEYILIPKSIIICGIFFCTMYMLYLYILGKANLYKYGICIILIILFTITNIYNLKKKKKNNYTIDVLILYVYMTLFSNIECMLYTTAITLLIIGINVISKSKTYNKKLPIGFYLCVSNICIIILHNFLIFSIRWFHA